MSVVVMLSRRWILTTVLVVLGAAGCARLGIWQLDRLAQRRAFNAHVAAVRVLPAVRLPATETLESQEYRSAWARGSYDYQHQVAIRNQAHEGQPGHRLLTPFLIEETSGVAGDPAAVVLVDRGWIPAEGNEHTQDWHQYDVPGPLEIRGVIRLPQATPVLGGMAQPTPAPGVSWTDYWLYVDVVQIGNQLPYAVLPVYLQLDASQNAAALPISEPPTLELTEGPHQGYALQWFSFALILMVGYPIYVGKQETSRA